MASPPIEILKFFAQFDSAENIPLHLFVGAGIDVLRQVGDNAKDTNVVRLVG
jgi:hypothetical protein